jgi:protein-disulfide isomerase
VGAARAQDSDADLRNEIEQLKLGQKQINQQLEEIKKLLAQQRQAPAAAAPARPNVENQVFDIGANPVKGASTAKLTLVEFTDYQ